MLLFIQYLGHTQFVAFKYNFSSKKADELTDSRDEPEKAQDESLEHLAKPNCNKVLSDKDHDKKDPEVDGNKTSLVKDNIVTTAG
jgi:hypothetical protein